MSTLWSAHLRSPWTGMLPIHFTSPANSFWADSAASLLKTLLSWLVRMAKPLSTRLQIPLLNASIANAARLRRSRPCEKGQGRIIGLQVMFGIAAACKQLLRASALTVARLSCPSATSGWLESVFAILSSVDSQTTGGEEVGDAKQLTVGRNGSKSQDQPASRQGPYQWHVWRLIC